MRNTSSDKSSEKNLENQRSINTQTLKILRIRFSETTKVVANLFAVKNNGQNKSQA